MKNTRDILIISTELKKIEKEVNVTKLLHIFFLKKMQHSKIKYDVYINNK